MCFATIFIRTQFIICKNYIQYVGFSFSGLPILLFFSCLMKSDAISRKRQNMKLLPPDLMQTNGSILDIIKKDKYYEIRRKINLTQAMMTKSL